MSSQGNMGVTGSGQTCGLLDHSLANKPAYSLPSILLWLVSLLLLLSSGRKIPSLKYKKLCVTLVWIFKWPENSTHLIVHCILLVNISYKLAKLCGKGVLA